MLCTLTSNGKSAAYSKRVLSAKLSRKHFCADNHLNLLRSLCDLSLSQSLTENAEDSANAENPPTSWLKGFLEKRRLPTLPLAQYHRRGRA